MLRYIVCFSVLLAMTVSPATAEELSPESKIQSVLVFPSGAEVVRTAKAQLTKGDHTIVFGNLPLQAISGSIRVEAKATGNLKISSVDSRRAYLSEDDARAMDAERRRLNNELQTLQDDREVEQGRIDAAEAQRNLVNNLASLPTRPAPQVGARAASEDWPQILALIGSSIHDINGAIRDAKVRIRDLDRKIKDVKNRLNEIAPQRNRRTEVKVHVTAETPLDADLLVRYQISSASWKPFYDARLSSGTKTIAPKLELTRRATIKQHTGERWEDVEMSLSTTRPKAGAAAPELRPITVDFWQPPRPVPTAAEPAPVGMAFDEVAAELEQSDDRSDKRRAVARLEAKRKLIRAQQANAEVSNAPFQAVFRVPGKVSVNETGEAKKIQIVSQILDPALSIRTVPKVDAKAYLYSKIILPRGAPLLPGPVSLFRDGTFVGNGQLPVLVGGEEHELGFGIDDLVRVRYRVVKDNKGESGGLISVSETENKSFLVTLKNLHERAIAYQILDQIPYSKNEEIVVQLVGKTAPTEQNVDDKRGILTWKGEIAPDEERHFEFGYRVSWPGGKKIIYQN